MPWRSLVGATEDMPVNMRAPQCITGGAAGASAAAVAAGEVSFAVDTDHLAGVRVRCGGSPVLRSAWRQRCLHDCCMSQQ